MLELSGTVASQLRIWGIISSHPICQHKSILQSAERLQLFKLSSKYHNINNYFLSYVIVRHTGK